MEKKKYEFDIVSGVSVNAKLLNEANARRQNDGWEVCGNALLYQSAPQRVPLVEVPMRRELREIESPDPSPKIEKFEPSPEILEVAKELCHLNTSTLLTGSLMLAMKGIYVGRAPSDIDLRITDASRPITLPAGCMPVSSHEGYGDDGTTRYTFKYKGFKVDFLYNKGLPKGINILLCGGALIPAATVESLLEVKKRYAAQNNGASEKHKKDIDLINKQYETIEKSNGHPVL